MKYGGGDFDFSYEGVVDAQGRPHGPGTATDAYGDLFTGEFHHGEMTGVFSWYTRSGHKGYEGGYLKGSREGQGTMWYEDCMSGEIHHGLFKDDRLIRGTITYPDGRIEHGLFKDYNFIRGTITYPDGRVEQINSQQFAE